MRNNNDTDSNILLNNEQNDIERDGLLNARLLSLGGDLVKEARLDRSCVDADLFTSLPDHEAQYRIEFELHAAKLYSFTIDEQVQGEQTL